MIPAVHLLELRFVHMSVDLRRGNVGMPEQFLNDPQIGTAGQQVGCKTVP